MAITTTTMERKDPTIAGANRMRALAVAGAAITAVAIWAVAVPVLGTHLMVRFGAGAPQSVGVDYVIGASIIGSLAGWALLALLERRTPRALSIWTGIAAVATLISLSLPLVAGVTSATRITLAAMHVAVGTVIITVIRASQAPLGS